MVDTEILEGNTVLGSNSIVHIDAVPTMPALKTRLKNAAGMTGTVDWKLTISFTRPNRNDSSDITGSNIAANGTWTVPWGNNFYGGTATLTGTYKKGANTTQICAVKVAHIRGTNPSVSTLEIHIGSSPWYAVAVSRQEHGSDG